MSNATTASILLPVLKDISLELGLNPLYLLLPVVLSCNYTFMLPASCPPNAIVYKVTSTLNLDTVSLELQTNLRRSRRTPLLGPFPG